MWGERSGSAWAVELAEGEKSELPSSSLLPFAPVFAPETYVARRRALAHQVGEGLIVLPGNAAAPMNYAANYYPFRQDGSFLYYAGLDEAGLALVVDAGTGEATLYGHDPTMDDVVWEGALVSLADRAARSGLTATAPTEQLETDVQAALASGRPVHVLPPYRGDTHLQLSRLLGTAPADVRPSEELMAAVIAQRLVKTEEEVAELDAALEVTAAMHRVAMRMAQPGRSEYEVAAAVELAAASRGSFPSFPPIVTVRGEVLHNHPTATRLQSGDLLLVDTGGVSPERRYAGDVTRVAPVGGRFSDRQRSVYDVVLKSQLAAIAATAPGVPWREVHDLSARVIVDGLKDLGLMRGDTEAAVAAGAHALFYPHGLGHALGLDVHDAEALGEDRVGYDAAFRRSEQFGTRFLRFARPLKEGYVMTVEPGVYFIGPLIDQWKAAGQHTEFVDYDEAEKWVGFGGVRIEDDVVVTAMGSRVLGPGIPKDPADVEDVVQEGA